MVAPNDGSSCIKVHAGVSGVRIAGVMLEASVMKSEKDAHHVRSLLEWGTSEVSFPEFPELVIIAEGEHFPICMPQL